MTVTTVTRRPMWTLMEDLSQVRDEFNRSLSGRKPHNNLDAWMADDNLIVEVEVPGIDPSKVEVSVEGTELTIAGKRDTDAVSDKQEYLIKERLNGDFARKLELPFQVESTKVTARCRNGVLRITLPRSEVEKPRKIAISAE